MATRHGENTALHPDVNKIKLPFLQREKLSPHACMTLPRTCRPTSARTSVDTCVDPSTLPPPPPRISALIPPPGKKIVALRRGWRIRRTDTHTCIHVRTDGQTYSHTYKHTHMHIRECFYSYYTCQTLLRLFSNRTRYCAIYILR